MKNLNIKVVIEASAANLRTITESPQREARILLAYVLEKSPEWCITHDDYVLNEQQRHTFENHLKDRLNHKPLAKILGYKEFYGRKLSVSENVLDPRPDSEILIEAVYKYSQNFETALDLGTGSGCLIVTLLAEFSQAIGTAIDISQKALELCRKNAQTHQVDNRLNFVQSSWFDSLEAELYQNHFDIVISNPPYIKTADIMTLDKTVKNFDPNIALDGGTDGLRDYRTILKSAGPYLSKNGKIFLEIGQGQESDIANIARTYGFGVIEVLKDLAGIDRVMVLELT